MWEWESVSIDIYIHTYRYIYNLPTLNSVRHNICDTVKKGIARKQNNVTYIQVETVKTDDPDIELYQDYKISMINVLKYL